MGLGDFLIGYHNVEWNPLYPPHATGYKVVSLNYNYTTIYSSVYNFGLQ